MSLTSPAAADQYSVKMSEAATTAAEEAAYAAKLATVQNLPQFRTALECNMEGEASVRMNSSYQTKEESIVNSHEVHDIDTHSNF